MLWSIITSAEAVVQSCVIFTGRQSSYPAVHHHKPSRLHRTAVERTSSPRNTLSWRSWSCNGFCSRDDRGRAGGRWKSVGTTTRRGWRTAQRRQNSTSHIDLRQPSVQNTRLSSRTGLWFAGYIRSDEMLVVIIKDPTIRTSLPTTARQTPQ